MWREQREQADCLGVVLLSRLPRSIPRGKPVNFSQRMDRRITLCTNALYSSEKALLALGFS